MSEIDIGKLRAVAEAATPGPWYQTGDPWYDNATGVVAGSPDGNIAAFLADLDPMGYRDMATSPFKLAEPEADAKYIATFDPPTVLSLLSRLEKAETKYRCPIGAENGSDFCSAGSCPECLDGRLGDAQSRLASAEAGLSAARDRIGELEAALEPLARLGRAFPPKDDRFNFYIHRAADESLSIMEDHARTAARVLNQPQPTSLPAASA